MGPHVEAELGTCRNRGQLRRSLCVLTRHPYSTHQDDSHRSALPERQATEEDDEPLGGTAVTSCKKGHNRALVVVMVVTVVCSVQGTGRDRRDSTAAGQGGGGAGECSKPRRCEEVRGTGKWT